MSELSQLSDKIASRLRIIYGQHASNAAREYIENEIETARELMDNLDAGHEDSGLVDHIINKTKFKATQSKEIHSMLMQACIKTQKNTQTEKKAINSLLKIFQNILINPSEIEKFGNLNSAKIQKKFAECQPAMQLLKRIGFKESEDGSRLVWESSDETLRQLNAVHYELQAKVGEHYPISTVLKLFDYSAMCEDKAVWIDEGVDAWWHRFRLNHNNDKSVKWLEIVGAIIKLIICNFKRT